MDDDSTLTAFAGLHPARAMLGYANFQTESVWSTAQEYLDVTEDFGVVKEDICMLAAAPFNPQHASLIMTRQDDPKDFETMVIESAFADVKRELQGMGITLLTVETNDPRLPVVATPEFLREFQVKRPEPASPDSDPEPLTA